jgi:transmembrane protein TMEM260 (protein O-mannosyltransferase)
LSTPISASGAARAFRGIAPAHLAAVGVFAVAFVVYLRTLLPGPSFGDWAEMQFIPAQLGITHPTGYPLYVLLGKLFSLLPIGSWAYRADLLSTVAAAGAAATSVLIATRLGVRPLLAAAAGLSLAVTGTLWLEATFSEMNGLHVFLVAAVIHRALVWRAERRDSDLRLGGLLAGLAVANHLLALTVVPIVVLFVLVDARARLFERPLLLVQTALLGLIGVSLYLYIPLRALAGPPSIYASFLTWDGFSSLVTGAQFRGQMHFSSEGSLIAAWKAVPDVVGQFVARSNVVFVAGGLIGGAILLSRDKWAALMLGLVAASSIFFFANYVGDLDHYLLVAWLVVAVWLAVAAEAFFAWLDRRFPSLGEVARLDVLALALPLVIATSNWTSHDESDNHVGEQFAPLVFSELPRDAVLLTYWDALTNLTYAHCIEGQRPDLSLRAYDVAARVVCDPVTGTLQEVARERPVFALFAFESELNPLRESFDLVEGPTLPLPYGDRDLDHSGVLYQLVPKEGAGAPQDIRG